MTRAPQHLFITALLGALVAFAPGARAEGDPDKPAPPVVDKGEVPPAPEPEPVVQPPAHPERSSGALRPAQDERTGAKSKEPKGRRGIHGTITDADTGAPVPHVVVRIVSGGEGEDTTDTTGRYRLDVGKGTYTIRILSELHVPKRVRVRVTRRSYTLDVDLDPSEEAVEVVVIEAPAESKTEAGVLQIRKKATTVSDSLSAQEMSRSPDSSAAGAVKRVVSATVIDGKYVLVRGLGGRYMTTLLNGVTLPSPEPDRQAVPLDLFPTSLLANLTVAKSYSARAPGTFAGGTLMIETNSYPTDFTLKAKVSTSATTGTTGEARNTYDTGSLDFFGFDDGTRTMPSSVPTDKPLRVSGDLDAMQVEQIGESFSNNWGLKQKTSYPNLSTGLTVGDTDHIDGHKLGYLATASFSHGFDVRDAEVGKVAASDMGLTYREQTKSVRGTEEATMGGLVNVGYQLDDHNDLSIFGLLTHTGESQATHATGRNETDGLDVDATRLKFEERKLGFLQLVGKHRVPAAHDLHVRWQANFAQVSSNEPDTRDVEYNLLADGRERLKNEPGSGERYYAQLGESSFGGGVDVELPLGRATLRAGSIAQSNSRDFESRRFRMEFIGSDPSVLFEPIDTIFSPENIGPAFQMQERTLATDAYTASLFVMGNYGEAELGITDALRVIGGVRYEISNQEMIPGSPYGLGVINDDDKTKRNDADWLPAASAIYALTPSMNLRAAYSYTLARPRFRELAPFLYFDYQRRRSVSGNPELLQTRIHNADLRWEWFASDTEVFATSVFYKKFNAPIEQVIVGAANGDISYANAARANLYGTELEARMSLGRLAGFLDHFKAQANISLIKSSIVLTPEQQMAQTSKSRPLQGQSPYVVNAGLGYADQDRGLDFNLFYNVFGRRIDEVGINTLPDVYEQPFDRADATASVRLNPQMRLKLAGKNLLNRKVELRQGDLAIFSQSPGVSLSASLEWSP